MPGSRIDEFPICQRIRPIKADAEKDGRNDFSGAGDVVPSPNRIPPFDFTGYTTWLSIRRFTENEYNGFRSIAPPELLGTVEADSVRIDLVDRHQETATALNAEADERCEDDGLPDRRVS